MRVCYLSGGRNVPSVRFRLPFFERLSERGHTCDILHNHPSRYDHYPLVGWRASQSIRRLVQHWNRWRVRVGRYDAVVLETGLFHTADDSFEKRLREVASRLIYEIDDAVFLLFPEKCQAIATMADHVIAGNESIAQWARQFNSQVSVIPTCVDEKVYIGKEYNRHRSTDRMVIGWIGSSGNVAMLRMVEPAISRLAAEFDLEFRIVTSRKRPMVPLNFGPATISWVDVDRCHVVGELHCFDVGIMPLPADEPWMRFKCNAKMIQYMGAGVPAIGSAVGFNLELIRDGIDGLLANNDQWEQCLRKLLASEELRRRIGQAGRDKVLQGFTVQSQIERYEAVLKGEPTGPA